MIKNEYIPLTATQSKEVDAYTIETIINGQILMENAGQSVVDVITEQYAKRPCTIYCGTGNNGGDGFVIARLLHGLGWNVEVIIVGEEDKIDGDALIAKDKCIAVNHHKLKSDFVSHIDSGVPHIIVDAIFGTGLSREINGQSEQAIETINNSHAIVISVDIPSGINCTTGEVMGHAVHADITVTFGYPKIGHYLLPAKKHVGELNIKDIGLVTPPNLNVNCYVNHPALWEEKIPQRNMDSHKYKLGHSIIVGGGFDDSSGAAELTGMAAARIGSGLSTIVCPKSSLDSIAATMRSVMVKGIDEINEFEHFISDPRKNAFAVGMGCGVNNDTKEKTLAILAQRKPCVIDADAITVFQYNPKELLDALHRECVITPHEGEFLRLFNVSGNKMDRVKKAARISGCTVILKGNDTVISTGETTVINTNAPPWLATAGSGDVLAGMICGLMAQGMRAFDATCAAIWKHSDIANKLGSGLIADDLLLGISKSQHTD